MQDVTISLIKWLYKCNLHSKYVYYTYESQNPEETVAI